MHLKTQLTLTDFHREFDTPLSLLGDIGIPLSKTDKSSGSKEDLSNTTNKLDPIDINKFDPIDIDNLLCHHSPKNKVLQIIYMQGY